MQSCASIELDPRLNGYKELVIHIGSIGEAILGVLLLCIFREGGEGEKWERGEREGDGKRSGRGGRGSGKASFFDPLYFHNLLRDHSEGV